MPHQCLKCGLVFEEGSSQLLKGCPDCGGNRFFFTKKPLDEKERKGITEEVGKDINSAIMKLMFNQSKEVVDQSGNWVNIKPKDIRKAMEQQLSERKKIVPKKKEDIDIITDDGYRKTAIEKVEAEVEQADSPETIDIEKPGKYKIDLKGLLEEEPIIIQKDGSYTIHLPSIFKMIDKGKKE
jgi:predicted  nucleic acid-binding Zn-ribbon protein